MAAAEVQAKAQVFGTATEQLADLLRGRASRLGTQQHEAEFLAQQLADSRGQKQPWEYSDLHQRGKRPVRDCENIKVQLSAPSNVASKQRHVGEFKVVFLPTHPMNTPHSIFHTTNKVHSTTVMRLLLPFRHHITKRLYTYALVLINLKVS